MLKLNDSKSDIISNGQEKYKSREYILDDMSGYMDVGIYRKKQEDAILLLEHPLEKNFKLLSIADGMGGLACGAIASNTVMRELITWFENTPVNNFNNEKKLLEELKKKIILIDEIVRKKCSPGGTTLSLALVANSNVILLNVGDSRIYVDSATFYQVGRDMSISWELYEKGIIKNKDDIRYHKENNLITSRIGCEKKQLLVDAQIISNNDYSGVYMFTDGVTDCISEKTLRDIIYKNEISSNICKTIVDEALNTISIREDLNPDEYYLSIQGGKDNATAACYKRRMKVGK